MNLFDEDRFQKRHANTERFIRVVGVITGIGVIGFAVFFVWLIIKLMQHFGVL